MAQNAAMLVDKGLYFIVSRFQINKLKRIVLEIDGGAFISLQEVSDSIRKPAE